MEKKYFDTKQGSVEEKINTIATSQPSISKPVTDVKLSVDKKYFETKKGSIEEIASKLVESKLDPVNKDAVKKKFDDRKDKDIDNDGDTDSTDKYLHKRRAAISKATEAVSPAQQAAIAISKKERGEKPKNEDLDSKDNSVVKRVIGKLKGASQAHAGQAKELDKALKSEDLDAQPQDKDVKKKDGTQPKKYYKSLSKDIKNKRADHFKSKDTTKNDNQPAPGDKDAKTKPSIHTQKYKKMFGEDFLNEKNATITINKITKPAVHRQISDVIKKMGSKAPKVTKTANGYVMAGDVKAITGVVDYLFDKELRNIINPSNPPFDIKMLKNDMSEADLTKSQIKKVHDKADELPKKDFKDRYGKEKGDDVRYAVATNIIKKKLGIK